MDVKGRLTFDPAGKLIGSGGSVPPEWRGKIPVEFEWTDASGKPRSKVVKMEAAEYFHRLERRSDFPLWVEHRSTSPEDPDCV